MCALMNIKINASVIWSSVSSWLSMGQYNLLDFGIVAGFNKLVNHRAELVIVVLWVEFIVNSFSREAIVQQWWKYESVSEDKLKKLMISLFGLGYR